MGRRGEIALYPLGVGGETAMLVGRRGFHDVDLVFFYQLTKGFLQARAWLAIVVGEAAAVDIHYLALTPFLPVVYPANHGHHSANEALVVHAVGAMEMGGLWVM